MSNVNNMKTWYFSAFTLFDFQPGLNLYLGFLWHKIPLTSQKVDKTDQFINENLPFQWSLVSKLYNVNA